MTLFFICSTFLYANKIKAQFHVHHACTTVQCTVVGLELGIGLGWSDGAA